MSTLNNAIEQIDALLAAVDDMIARGAPNAPIASTSAADAAPPAPKKQKKKDAKGSKAADAASGDTKPSKPWVKATPKQPASGGTDDDPFHKANLRVARILEVDVVENSEKLYKLKVDAGGEPLQVVAGLRQHVPSDEMLNRLVVTILNLKPAKLAGQLSEAMILAADYTTPDNKLVVGTLQPPEGAKPGDPVYLEGAQPPAATPKTMKKEQWGAVVDKLRTKDQRPAYDNVPFCTSAGPVTLAKNIPDGSSIH